MIVRYYKNARGKAVKLADLYEKEEHGIEKRKIDPNALFICGRLRDAGFDAYIVGGAVRDMIAGRKPKDFDIVTDAYPKQIKKLFRGAKIIGKRFLLVHVIMDGNIYEISTFRSNTSVSGDNNCFGTIKEDVWRRDFTINALYYCPVNETVIDFIGGFKDLKKRLVKPVMPLKIIFQEDPVRLIRAVKYSVMIGGDLPFLLKFSMYKNSSKILYCSSSRLTEEIFKIMKMDDTEKVFRRLAKLNILRYILPGVYEVQKNRLFYETIGEFDTLKREGKSDLSKTVSLIVPLISDFLESVVFYDGVSSQPFSEIIKRLKKFLSPMIPPNLAVIEAVKIIMAKNGYKIRTKRNLVRKNGDF